MQFDIGNSDGRKAYNNGENPFKTTSKSGVESEGIKIEIDGAEAMDVAVKSIISGVATGLVVNRFLE